MPRSRFARSISYPPFTTPCLRFQGGRPRRPLPRPNYARACRVPSVADSTRLWARRPTRRTSRVADDPSSSGRRRATCATSDPRPRQAELSRVVFSGGTAVSRKNQLYEADALALQATAPTRRWAISGLPRLTRQRRASLRKAGLRGRR
ncbi:MAG: hypothetical protein WKG07_15405 [Hymenobacter sp.]